MKSAIPSTADIMKEWLFSSTENRYIHKVLSKEKELEMDIDGTLYFHLKFPLNNVHYRMVKNFCDETYTRDYSFGRDHLITEDVEEYYYMGPVIIVARDFESQELIIQLKCENNELFQEFLRWDASLVDIISFLEKYVKPQ